MVASFLIGLRPNSRIKMELNNQIHPLETILLARVVDNLSILIWSKTKDGSKGKNPPKSISELLMRKQDDDVTKFATGEDFERERQAIINSIKGVSK